MKHSYLTTRRTRDGFHRVCKNCYRCEYVGPRLRIQVTTKSDGYCERLRTRVLLRTIEQQARHKRVELEDQIDSWLEASAEGKSYSDWRQGYDKMRKSE
jgi:hypothetical protein